MRITGNKYGILINECCGSCKFKELRDLGANRYCSLTNKKVKSLGLCEHWKLSKKLKKVGGYKDGKVKKKEYLDYILGVRVREEKREGKAKSKGEVFKPKTIAEIRKAFEYQHRSSIYMDL